MVKARKIRPIEAGQFLLQWRLEKTPQNERLRPLSCHSGERLDRGQFVRAGRDGFGCPRHQPGVQRRCWISCRFSTAENLVIGHRLFPVASRFSALPMRIRSSAGATPPEPATSTSSKPSNLRNDCLLRISSWLSFPPTLFSTVKLATAPSDPVVRLRNTGDRRRMEVSLCAVRRAPNGFLTRSPGRSLAPPR